MPEVTVRTPQGGTGATLTLREDVFGRAVSAPLLHQVVVRHLANARQGTHDTQTRGEVDRTTKKVWRQKGTGRARQGSRKGPHWTGGGVAHGPHPRSYRQDLPKKMRAAALRAALSSKAEAGQIVVLSELSLEAPSTKTLNAMMRQVAPGGSALLVLDSPNQNVQLSARNLPDVTAITTENLNAYDILRHEQLVLTEAAVRVIETRWAKPSAAETNGTDTAAASAAAAPAAEPPAGAEAVEAPKAGRTRSTRKVSGEAAGETPSASGEAAGEVASDAAGARE